LDNYYKNKQFLNDDGIYASKNGDFYCEEKYTFEVGGENKGFDQIKDIPNSFVASDDLEVGIIILLDEYGYPPVERDEVYQDIFDQAENFKRNR
jgi:hypothetical protein